MRILFAGTPQIAAPSLERLARDHEIVGVLTNPDRTQGRGKKVIFSPVKQVALDLNLKILQPEKLVQEVRDEIAELKPDLLVAVAYGKIFGPKFLGLFPRGGVNLHPSLLPLYRGATPINAAILNGDDKTGVTIQRLALEMDAGDILSQREYDMTGQETAESLTEYFSHTGAELLGETLNVMEKGTLDPSSQDESQVTFCGMINKDDGLIDWSDSAEKIERTLRAYTPWPGIFTFFQEKKLNIVKASLFDGMIPGKEGGAPGEVLALNKKIGILIQTGEGVLAVQVLQLQSKKAMDHLSFCNGIRDFIGARLGGLK